MQYLVVFTPKEQPGNDGPPSDFQEVESKEEQQVRVLHADGSLRQVWALDTEDKGAAVLFEAGSTGDLRKMIDSFPLVQADYSEYRIFPLAPYPAFGEQP